MAKLKVDIDVANNILNIPLAREAIISIPTTEAYRLENAHVYPLIPIGGQSPLSSQEQTSFRYSLAEKALKTSLDSACSSQTSPVESQIKSLRKLTALLDDHARGARGRINELRSTLADRSLEPALYSHLQHERWMEERRYAMRHEQSHVLKSMLSQRTELMPTPAPLSSTSISRYQANLSDFFSRSPTRVSFPANTKVTSTLSPTAVPPLSSVASRKDYSTLLRPDALVSAFSNPIMGIRQTRTHLSRFSAEYSKTVQVPQPHGGHGALPLPTLDPKSDHTQSCRATATTMYPQSPSTLGSPNGTAIIYAPATPRTVEEVTASLNSISLPEYAVSLLESFGQAEGAALPHVSGFLTASDVDSTASSSTAVSAQKGHPTISSTLPETGRDPHSSPFAKRILRGKKSHVSLPKMQKNVFTTLSRPLSSIFGNKARDYTPNSQPPFIASTLPTSDDTEIESSTITSVFTDHSHQLNSLRSKPGTDHSRTQSKAKGRFSVLGKA